MDGRGEAQEWIGYTWLEIQKPEIAVILRIFRVSKILNFQMLQQNNQHLLSQVSITKVITIICLLDAQQTYSLEFQDARH